MSLKFNFDNNAAKNSKILFVFIFIIVTFIIYIFKLFSMQVIEGEDYRNRSESISTKQTIIPAQRGEIYDRNAILPLVTNEDSFAIDIIPGEIPEELYNTTITKLATFLDMKKEDIDKKIPKEYRRKYVSREIKTNISFSTVSNIAENITDLPGVYWRNRPKRNYSTTNCLSLSHILGYVGNITFEELQLLYNQGYNQNSIVGKIGIEKQYDKILQGKSGYEKQVRNASGKIINTEVEVTPPQSGNNLVLTVDSSIQILAEKALGDRVGAVVVLKPDTGEVLAMVSYPYFDSNIFSTDYASQQLVNLTKDPNKPLLNRAIFAEYPPASTFKTIMTTAILNENSLPPTKKIECRGRFNFGNRLFKCHKDVPGHGWLDLKNSLAQSCDVYFWVVGRDLLGVEKIASYAKIFGFGSSLEIDLPSHKEGFVPTAQWKERRFHEKWQGGDTMNISIGQGYTLVTPLHVANMMAMVCNNGKIYKPHLLKEIRDSSTNKIISEIKPEVLHDSDIDQNIWKQVQENLRYTITDGTAIFPMHNKTVKIAGKTGTAEVNGYEENHWHSWMVAYAPYDAEPKNQVVVATIVEAVNDWEWWAPYATNIIIQGIFNEQTYEESVKALGFNYLIKQQGRRE